jgi:hypothetical protein
MILTGAEFKDYLKALYGDVWLSAGSKRLNRSKTFIKRLCARQTGLPLEYQRILMDLIDEQFAILGQKRARLAATFDDAG